MSWRESRFVVWELRNGFWIDVEKEDASAADDDDDDAINDDDGNGDDGGDDAVEGCIRKLFDC